MNVQVTLSDPDTLRARGVLSTMALKAADGKVIDIPESASGPGKRVADLQSAALLDALRPHGVTEVIWDGARRIGYLQRYRVEVGRLDPAHLVPAPRSSDDDIEDLARSIGALVQPVSA